MNALPIMAMLLAGFCVAWFAIPFVWRKRQEALLRSLCKENGLVALTYDDGPSLTLTPKLIELLGRHKVKASFFVLGERAAREPGLVESLLAHGHEVGSHTQKHCNAWKTLPWRAARDRRAGISTVDRLGGSGYLFRPPYGKLSLEGLIVGLLNGLQFAFWTVDPRDSWNRRPIEEVLAELDAQGGGVVLMHDFDRYAAGEHAVSHVDHVLALTERLILFSKFKGLRMVRFGDIRVEKMEVDRLA